MCIMWLKQFKLWKIPAVVYVEFGTLTCTLFHSMCDLKATHMNMHNLTRELRPYEFKFGHNAAKNICSVKDEGTLDHSTVTK